MQSVLFGGRVLLLPFLLNDAGDFADFQGAQHAFNLTRVTSGVHGFDDPPTVAFVAAHQDPLCARGIRQTRHVAVVERQEPLRLGFLARVLFHGGNFDGVDVDAQHRKDDRQEKRGSERRHK